MKASGFFSSSLGYDFAFLAAFPNFSFFLCHQWRKKSVFSFLKFSLTPSLPRSPQGQVGENEKGMKREKGVHSYHLQILNGMLLYSIYLFKI